MNEKAIYIVLMLFFIAIELRLWAMHDTLKEIRESLKVTNMGIDQILTYKRIEELNERTRHV